MTVDTVFQLFFPLRFVPRNLAPGSRPDAPPIHMADSFSGDHSPIRVTSDTMAQTLSTGAAISWVTLT
jgi:hypothetical protein